MVERPNLRKHAESADGGRPVSLEEAEIVEKVRAGNVHAYEQLVIKYQDRVFNACWRICGNIEDARDLTQEAFMKALESIGGFRHESGFYTWIFRVAVNLALSHRRKAARQRTVSLDHTNADGTQAEILARRVGDRSHVKPERNASDDELKSQLSAALVSLDDDHRAVIVLRDIEGMDYRAIGGILDLAPGTVKSRLFRARQALKEAMVGQTPSDS